MVTQNINASESFYQAVFLSNIHFFEVLLENILNSGIWKGYF